MITFESIAPYERRLVDLLEELKTAQLRHIVVDDPDAPRFPAWWRLLINPKRTMRRHFFAQMRYARKRGEPEFRSPSPLADLWMATRTHRRFRPVDVQENDIAFDDFTLSFRLRPCESTFYWYYVVFPNGNREFKPIAHECSLRFFVGSSPQTNCHVPEDDDFQLIRVNSKGFDLESRPRKRDPCIPTVLDIYLPGLAHKWELIVSDSNDFESIIDT